MLKFLVTDISTIPEPLREHYTKTADGYTLGVEDHPAEAKVTALSTKIDEFRANNTSLLKKLDGTDPAALKAKIAELTASASAPQARVVELESQLAVERAATAATILKSAVSGAFLAAGGRPEAQEFMEAAASKIFTVKDGVIGTETVSPTTPGQKLTVTEWLSGQMTSAAFAFAPSSGGGAPPRNLGGGKPGDGKRVLTNPTPKELGENAAAITRGECRVQYTT